MREERDPIDHVRDLLVAGEPRDRGRAQGHRQGDQGGRQRGRPVRPGQPRAGRGRALDRRIRLREGRRWPTQILMPALSPTMEEGTLAKWLVKEGDAVTSGQILAEIETDKATMEFEAVDEGTIGKILIAEGTEGVKVNTPIAVLLDEGEDASAAERRGRGAAPRDRRRAAGRRPAAAMPAAAAGGADGAARRAPEVPEGTTLQDPDRARGAARRHGRGDAPRRRRLPDGRGGRRVPGRLQDQPGPARRVRRRGG